MLLCHSQDVFAHNGASHDSDTALDFGGVTPCHVGMGWGPGADPDKSGLLEPLMPGLSL